MSPTTSTGWHSTEIALRHHPPGVENADPLAPLVATLRTVTFALGTFVATPAITRGETDVLLAAGIALGATTWRILAPLHLTRRSLASELALAVDLAMVVGAVAVSGRWESPYVLTVAAPIVQVGVARGYVQSLVAAGLVSATLLLIELRSTRLGDIPAQSVQLGLLLLLAGIFGGYARRLFLEGERERATARARIRELTDTNALLAELYEAARALPDSFDLDSALAQWRGRLGEVVAFDAFTVMLPLGPGGGWRVASAFGSRLPATFDELPGPLAAAAASRGVLDETDLAAIGGGVALSEGSGLYARLTARGAVVAVMALEHLEPRHFGPADVEAVTASREVIGLVVANAEWMARISLLAAEEERARIARDLHDRVAQSLASVGFELERVARSDPDTIALELRALREHTRTALEELRETLRQLRSGVTAEAELVTLIRQHLPAFSERTAIDATFRTNAEGVRLAPKVEQEVWRILQEALSNVERHARATSVCVEWTIEGRRARLVVADDGKGFNPSGRRRSDAFGIAGMHERARALSAILSLDSPAAGGTKLTLDLVIP